MMLGPIAGVAIYNALIALTNMDMFRCHSAFRTGITGAVMKRDKRPWNNSVCNGDVMP